jgi:hypothetical protein
LIGIDLIGKYLPGTSFQRLYYYMAVASSDLQQSALRLSGKIKIGCVISST